MKTETLSAEEKEHIKQRKALQKKCNAITVKWSVGQIHNWAGVYEFTSVPTDIPADVLQQHLAAKPTFAELKLYQQKLYEQLERKFTESSVQQCAGVREETTPVQAVAQNHQEPIIRAEESSQAVRETSPGTGICNEPTTKELNEPRLDKPAAAKGADEDYGLVSSPNEKVFLFWFQKKATKELLDGILGFDTSPFKTTAKLKEYILTLGAEWRSAARKRCQLLLAGTGTGKTFIAGALLRRLVDINFADGKTWGHVPYLYVTRATVVEQTERVFKNFFNLTIKDGVEVINIEQLRSKAGQLWLREEVVVENGKEKVQYKWKPYQQPCIILWDECQALKNEGTSQSEISYSYAECMPDMTHCVYISATPFTKVAEAKSFVLNINLTDNEL